MANSFFVSVLFVFFCVCYFCSLIILSIFRHQNNSYFNMFRNCPITKKLCDLLVCHELPFSFVCFISIIIYLFCKKICIEKFHFVCVKFKSHGIHIHFKLTSFNALIN